MTKNLEFYKCNICGNFVQVLLDGVGELVCCGQPMVRVEFKSEEAGLIEKHLPVVLTSEGKTHITIGSIEHPMEEKHYIQFVEAISKDNKSVYLKYLVPEISPKVEIPFEIDGEVISHCNIHGTWIKERKD